MSSTSTSAPPKINPRALNFARASAQSIVGKATNLFRFNPRITWAELATKLGLPPFPEGFARNQVSQSQLTLWGIWWVNGVEARLLKELEAPAEVSRTRIKDLGKGEDSVFYHVPNFDDLPEQQAAFKDIWNGLYGPDNIRAIQNDGNMGSGKTWLGVALFHKIIQEGFLEKEKAKSPVFGIFPPLMLVTRKNVLESWLRHFERAGMGKYLNNTIQCLSYSAFYSSFAKIYIREEVDPIDDRIIRYFWNPAISPYALILDEFHALNRDSKTSKIFTSLYSSTPNPPKTLCLSATPPFIPNHTKFFACATGGTFLGMKVNESNFNSFAKLLSNEPEKYSNEVAQRIRKVFAPYIVSFPRVKWPHKAINSVMLVDFANEHDREYYASAYDRFLEKCKKLGKRTKFNRFERAVAIGQFRLAVEPLHVDQIVDLGHQYIQRNEAAIVIGTAYKNSIVRAMIKCEKLGYGRNDISLIWGGKDDIKKHLVLSQQELLAIQLKTGRGEELTALDIKKIETTLAFRNERESFGWTNEETTFYHDKMRAWGIFGTQSAEARQREIDRFQNGDTKLCFFTLAAGGIGISLDQCKPSLLPRRGYFTPTYSGPEFKQALGRLPRRLTLSDTYQFIVGMRNTIEESHVIPAISEKLRCLSSVTNSDYDIMESITDYELLASLPSNTRLRTLEEAVNDENDEAQLHAISDNESDDDGTEEEIT